MRKTVKQLAWESAKEMFPHWLLLVLLTMGLAAAAWDPSQPIDPSQWWNLP